MAIDWARRPFSYFNRSEPCPVCGVPLTVVQDLAGLVWTVVHGEVPLLCWKDEWLGDQLVLSNLYRDWKWAVLWAHWR